MNTIDKFLQLHGKEVERAALEKLVSEAKKENNTEVVYRLSRVLLENPEDEYFSMSIKNFEQSSKLAAPKSKVNYKDALTPKGRLRKGWRFVNGNFLKVDSKQSVSPTIDNEILAGLEYCKPGELDEETLGKAVSPKEIYKLITDKIVAQIEANKDQNWEKTWKGSGYEIAYNFVSKKPYTSINQLLLGSSFSNTLLENPYYLTFKQIEKLKGKVRKGARAEQVVYYTVLYSYEQAKPKLKFATYDLKKFKKWIEDNKSKINRFKLQKSLSVDSFILSCKVPILKYYNVFNGADITGIDFDLENFKGVGYIKGFENNNEPIEACDAVIENYPEPSPKLIIGSGDRAFYNRSNDSVTMPNITSFKHSQAYYTTLFHEFIHSTGSPDRLKRTKGKKFGDKDYSFEELVAEIGAKFLCANSGILHYTLRNGAAYINSWHKVLIQHMKEDNKFIFKAASKAQKAAEFILQPDEDGEPKFLKKLSGKTISINKKDEALPPLQINSYDEWKQMMQPFYNFDVSLNYYKAAFETTINSKEAILVSINKKYTLQDLKGYLYTTGGKKAEYVNAYFENLLFIFINQSTIVGYQDTFQNKVKEIVQNADEAYLKKLLDYLKEKDLKRKKRINHLKKSFSNPETLEEFENFIKLKGEKKLSSEQLEIYDALYVKNYHKKMEDKRIELLERQNKLNNAVNISNVELEYNENKHTKTGEIIHVLSLVNRVDKNVYTKLNNLSKSFGGYYSSYSRNGAIPGFIFRTKSNSDSFLEALKNGNKPFDAKALIKKEIETRNAKLTKLKNACLERVEQAYENIERPRLTNTRRRQSIQSSVIYDQEEIIRANKIAINLVDGILKGKVIALKGLSHLTEVKSVISVIERATYEWMREQKERTFFTSTSPKTEELIKNEISFSDIKDYLKPSLLTLNKEVFQSLMHKYESKKGFKMIAQRLTKRAIHPKDQKHLVYIPSNLIADFDKVVKAETNLSHSIEVPYTRYKRLLKIIGSNNFKLLRQSAREVLQVYKEIEVYNSNQKEKNRIKKLLNEVQLTKIDGFFPTPEKLTRKLLNNLKVFKEDTILEPSAGIGSIAEVIREEFPENELTLIEKVDTLHEICTLKGFNCLNTNFLDHKKKYDVIIMNPPFEKNQDIDHVMHAFSLLNKGGRLIAIMANNKRNSSLKKRQKFEEFINENGWFEENESGSFKSSFKPTGVNTITVYLEKNNVLANPGKNEGSSIKDIIIPIVPGLSEKKESQNKPINEVAVNNIVESNRKSASEKSTGVLSSSDIDNMSFDTLTFSGEWAELMQEPATNMKLAIWGKPKNGKTAGATKLANYLTNFGSILYNFADQGINKSTKDLWKLSGLDKKENAYLTDTRDLKELDRLCASGKYDFVFIDMINTFIHRTGIKYFEFEDQFLKKYPNVSFILIFEVTKSGNFKGDQGWTHLPDALITVDSFVMHNQGRYGVGEYVVWKEGLKKVNPKKYKEFFTDFNEKLTKENYEFLEIVV